MNIRPNELLDDASSLLGVGCQINSWVIDSFVARGGFGNIYKGMFVNTNVQNNEIARDINTNENVIIKTGNVPGKNYLPIEAEIYQKVSGKGIPLSLPFGTEF